MLAGNARDLPRPGLAVAPGAPGADPRPVGIILPDDVQAAVAQAVFGLDAWLDSQRQPGGYCGPVVHWWRDCTDFTGPGLDWRYEGIITGYINLWASTRRPVWLEKATRAGDDLVRGQLPSGNYRSSCFEANPNTGGTPHEGAADLGLLRLATALRATGAPGWETYVETARRNLQFYYIDQLWDPNARSFRDDPVVPSFVPNKTATLCEALFAYARVSGDAAWIRQHALPALNVILAHQVTDGPLEGAIYQNSFSGRKVARFFPYYIARCIPALLEGAQWAAQGAATGVSEDRYLRAAHRAAEFVARSMFPDGSYPQVIYPHGRANRYPQWIAGAGDILRALLLARRAGFTFDPLLTVRWILAGRQPDGGIRAALGFGRVTPGLGRKDPRDSVCVVGWADKAFRVLTSLYTP